MISVKYCYNYICIQRHQIIYGTSPTKKNRIETVPVTIVNDTKAPKNEKSNILSNSEATKLFMDSIEAPY